MSKPRTLATIREVSHYDIDGSVLSVWRYNEDKGYHEQVKITLDSFAASGIAYLLRKYLARERQTLTDLIDNASREVVL